MGYDEDGSGRIDFYEFINALTTAQLDKAADACPKSLEKFRWSNDDINGLIQTKIVERARTQSELLRQAFYLFGRPQKGIDFPLLKSTLDKLGIVLTEAETQRLFDTYDSD